MLLLSTNANCQQTSKNIFNSQVSIELNRLTSDGGERFASSCAGYLDSRPGQCYWNENKNFLFKWWIQKTKRRMNLMNCIKVLWIVILSQSMLHTFWNFPIAPRSSNHRCSHRRATVNDRVLKYDTTERLGYMRESFLECIVWALFSIASKINQIIIQQYINKQHVAKCKSGNQTKGKGWEEASHFEFIFG